MLTTKNLHVFFGKAHILKDISISVGVNEIVSIIGANGVGKTTLLIWIQLVLTLMHELRRRRGGYGIASICGGLAQGEGILIKV